MVPAVRLPVDVSGAGAQEPDYLYQSIRILCRVQELPAASGVVMRRRGTTGHTVEFSFTPTGDIWGAASQRGSGRVKTIVRCACGSAALQGASCIANPALRKKRCATLVS